MKYTAARVRRAVLRATTHPHTASRGPGRGRRRASAWARANGAVLRLTTRVQEGLQEAARRPDRGDISTTTVIIWVAAVTGAVLIAGTIAVVIAKYNGKLSGL
ncbi:hypothetical protein KBP30_41060 [Streptomyces sp. Go40/10]|uniref:hypothetical protein n=1 Tax=Streptomyces sp. Go40/10 TaxID=2825844 RepID=UPI001E53A5F5|nr:hypothetical protein [Streptomyces sp. Go40/10]UFR07667.1 hypothetical protein KBP30_41060 [Streptomyces sp. Go40/10]